MQNQAKNIQGMSVSLPHKQTIMPFLDEISQEAKDLGAVNTVFNFAGKLIGYNTDFLGAIMALEDEELLSKNFVIIGR